MMKVYCFSGLGADERVFSFLNLGPEYELICIPWLMPLSSESLKLYAIRVSKSIDISEPFGLLGVSFGGAIAQEVSANLNPKFTIIISSLKSGKDILLFKVIPNWLIRLSPNFLFTLPRFLAYWIFGAENKELLKDILKDTDPGFVKWAIMAMSKWNGAKALNNVFYISGEKDRLLPPFKGTKVLADGHHFMIVDLNEQLAAEIRLFLSGQNFL